MVKRRRKKKEVKRIEHFLVPRHELLHGDEAEDVLRKFGVTKDRLPKIMEWDPAIADLGAHEGDIVRILREENGMKSTYYRVVVHG